VKVHDRRARKRVMHKGLAVTSVPEILLDLAATAPLRTLRWALAGAEYHKLLDLQEMNAVLKPGCRGARKLRKALQQHQPALARTKSRLERMLIEICEQDGLPLPEVNVHINGWEVDALWREHNLAVELDGYGNHHTPAQLRRDRRKEMALRQVGLTTHRYSEDQLKYERPHVAAELRHATTP
jgi:very-short-patch-repair endonuclease